MSTAINDSSPYKGRFAPSPTGPLHFGSLIAAVGSFLQARHQKGLWLVRMEDLDIPRAIPGAADSILRSLDQYGFEWDGSVIYQSQRTDYYHDALQTLQRQDLVYPCGCSRSEINEIASMGIDAPIYPGTCRDRLPPGKSPRSYRIRTNFDAICIEDALQGQICQILANDVGDFVLKRADGIIAYQLAVVIDDAAQEITEIVRGCDLLDSTPRQYYLQSLLSLPHPQYMHLPLAIDQHGMKLSKQEQAMPLDDANPVPALWSALDFLNQQPPVSLKTASLETLWQWALDAWSLVKIPRQRAIKIYH